MIFQYSNLIESTLPNTVLKIKDLLRTIFFSKKLGSTMFWIACSNDHAIFKDMCLSSTYDQWIFFSCNKVLPLNNQTPTLRSVPCAAINQLKAVRGTREAQTNKKPLTRFESLQKFKLEGALHQNILNSAIHVSSANVQKLRFS